MYDRCRNVHNNRGDIMRHQELLSALLKTTQTGQVEIRSLLDTAMGSNIRNTLQSQLLEYDTMETEVLTLALQRGCELNPLRPGVRFLTDRITRFQVNGQTPDSRIAEIMIQKNTKAMISSLKNQHQSQCHDAQLCILSQKIIDCITAHIRQLQYYL